MTTRNGRGTSGWRGLAGALGLGILLLLTALSGPRVGRDAGEERTPDLDSVSGITRVLEEAEERGEAVPEYLEAYLWWYRQRAYPYDKIDWSKYPAAERQRARMATARLRAWNRAVPTGSWEPLGPERLPVPYQQYFGGGWTSGRVSALAYDPVDARIIWLGAAKGGLWRSTDGGVSWTCLSNGWRNQLVSSIAVCPYDRNLVLVGTGDFDGGKPGYGIMKTTNGTAATPTWTLKAEGTIIGAVRRLLFSADPPLAGFVVYCAAGRAGGGGLWRSIDSGESWSSEYTATWSDLSMAAPPADPSREVRFLYATAEDQTGGFVRATVADGGSGWIPVNLPLTNTRQVGLGIAGSASNSKRVYLLSCTDRKVWRGDIDPNNPTLTWIWTDITAAVNGFPTGPEAGLAANYNWSQASPTNLYDWHIACGYRNDASGNRHDVLYVGLIDLVASTNVDDPNPANVRWRSVGQSYTAGALTHNDQHIMAFNPVNPYEMLVGNDGGVYGLSYATASDAWTWRTDLNARLQITQFYQGAYHPTDATRMLGGSQDNASPVCLGDIHNWVNRGGGDGGFCGISESDPNIQFATVNSAGITDASGNRIDTQLDIRRTSSQWSGADAQVRPRIGGDDEAGFIYPVLMDPADSNRLYVGTRFLNRLDGTTWTPRLGGSGGQVLTLAGNRCTALAASGGRMYIGTSDGRVWVTSDGGNSFRFLTTAALPNRNITGIAVQPDDPFDVLVCYSGTGGPHLFRCMDTGASPPAWASVNGNLPDIPYNTVCLDPADPTRTWLMGGDVGVFYTTDAGATWTNATAPLGLPNVEVDTLRAVPGTGYLMAATWGRGMWRIRLGTPTPTYSISGTVTLNGAGLGTVTVTAGGKSASTDASGAYRITGLAAGTYTVTPAKSGYSFTPANRSVTITNASVSGVNFTAASTQQFTISGTVTLGALTNRSGVTVTAGGRSTTTAANGSYTIAGLSPGNYTVTPSKTGLTFAPANRAVTITNLDVPNINFAAVTYTISGTVTAAGAGLSSVTLTAAPGNVRATTAANGTYTLRDLIPGSYTVTPSRSGYAFTPGNRSVTLGPSKTGIDFTAAPTSTFSISGTVTRTDGSGLDGVSVSAGGKTVTTGASGAYSIADLAGGTYSVTPSKTGYGFSPANRSVTVGPDATGVDFTATATGTFSIDGTVTLNGSGLAGVTVTAGGKSATTGTFGNYILSGLEPGSYTVRPAATGYAFTPASRSVTILDDDVDGVDFTATSTLFSISGTVSLQNGSGVSGVTVTAGTKAATTNTAGSFSITGLTAGTYTVRPARTGYAFSPASRSVTVGPNASFVNFTAIPFYFIGGKVTLNGAALAGVTVTARSEAPAPAQTGTTGSGGRYAIQGLVGGRWTVTPAKAGYRFTPVSRQVTLGPSAPTVDFTAAPDVYNLSGTVTLNGAGLAGVTVTAGGKSATTGAAGGYTLTGLAPGSYTVRPAKAGYAFTPLSRSVTITNVNLTGQNFTAAGALSLSGTVLLNGAGLAGVTVTAGARTTTTATTGRYRFDGLVPGSYVVRPAKTGYSFTPASRSVSLTTTSASGLDFTAAGALAISGTVTFNGAGLAGVTVTAGGQTITTGTAGTFRFAALAPATYTVRAAKTGYAFSPTSRSVTLTNAEATGQNFTAAGALSIGGLVAGARTGTPLAGVTVTGGGKTSTTGTGGRFLLSGLAPGSYLVRPAKVGYQFSPPSQTINLIDSSPTGIYFGALGGLSIGGKVTLNGAALPGVTLTAGTGQATTDATGTYRIQELTPGSYTVRPAKVEHTFTPPSRAVTLSTASATGVSFTATVVTYSISGTITRDGAAFAGAVVSAGGKSATTGTAGHYTITGLPAGTYAVTAAKSGFVFTPASRSVTVGPSATGVDFTAALQTYSFGGGIFHSGGNGIAGVTLTISGPGGTRTVVTTEANYSVSGFVPGTYTVTPTEQNLRFTPVSRTITITNANVTGVDFVADLKPYQIVGFITENGAPLDGVTVQVGQYSVVTGSGIGYYSIYVEAGTYTVTPSKPGYTFSPTSASVTVVDHAGQANFTATATGLRGRARRAEPIRK